MQRILNLYADSESGNDLYTGTDSEYPKRTLFGLLRAIFPGYHEIRLNLCGDFHDYDEFWERVNQLPSKYKVSIYFMSSKKSPAGKGHV